VLPLQNAGSDKEIDFLRFALADEVATTLSHVQSFSIRRFATTTFLLKAAALMYLLPA